MTEEVLQIIPLDRVAETAAVWDLLNPFMAGFVKAMIRRGTYLVTDDNGTRVPAEQALKLIP